MQETHSNKIPILVCLAAFFIFCWAGLLKYYHLSYFDWDLAFFSQAAWNLCHGSQFVSLVGINFFGDHSYYFMLLILPVFSVLAHPLTLIFLKIAAFVLSAYLLYRILRRDHPLWIAVTLMSLYLIFPANIFALLYEFNPEAFAPVFLLLVYDFFKRGKYASFLVSAFFLCLIKENMLLIVFMFGLIALFTKRQERSKWAWLPMIATSALFSLLVFWIIPLFRQIPQHAFWVRYQHIVEHPLRFFSKVIMGNAGYVCDLFGPLFLAIILAPQNLLYSAPVFLQHLFSNEYAEHTIYYHYGSALTPFIFLAAGSGILKVGRYLKPRTHHVAVFILVLLSVFHAVHFLPAMKARFIVKEDPWDAARWRMIRAIPADKGVVASFDFLAPLSTRRSLYSFHMIYDESFQDRSMMKRSELYKGRSFKLPDDVEYALIDIKDPYYLRTLKEKPDFTFQQAQDFMKNWTIVDQEGPILLLRRPVKTTDVEAI